MSGQFCILLLVTVGMAIVPLLSVDPYMLSVLTTVLLWTYLSSCWNILGGMAGQLSFGHAVFFGTAAYCSAALFAQWGWHPLAGGGIGIALACVMALAIGYVSARYGLVHLHFALVTTAVSQVVLFFAMGLQFIGGPSGLTVPFKATAGELFFRNPAVYYWIFLLMAAAIIALTLMIRERRMGLYFLCVRENEPAAKGIGIDIMRQKLVAMVISAGLTAAGGVIYAHYIRFLDPDSIFGWQISLQMVIPAMLGGTLAVFGPAVGSLIYVLLQEFTRTLLDFPGAPLIIVGAVLVPVVLYLPVGVVPSLAIMLRRRQRPGTARAVLEVTPIAPHAIQPATQLPRATGETLLRVEGLNRQFGGVQAVADVSFTCADGERLAIIGPNGAGKSTVFALLGGFIRPDSGGIWFAGQRIDSLDASRVCRLGLARTFQTAQPFRELTVLENIQASTYLRAPSRVAARSDAFAVMDLFQLTEFAHERSADLNIVDQKRLELARAWATRPRIILLDEVGAGLTGAELRQLTQTLAQLNVTTGVTIIFIEHVMSMVSELAERVIVLHHGRILAQGTAAEVTADPAVIEAYLGENELVAQD